jgi:hypothetical protein
MFLKLTRMRLAGGKILDGINWMDKILNLYFN